MNTIEELNLGFSDAQNYTKRANKQMFSDIFVRNVYLKKLLNPNIYYLIGEKGTGKTAYAVYLTNNEYDGNKAFIKFIQATDYEKFYELKKTKKIDVSGYVDIWKTILLLLVATCVTDDDRITTAFNKTNLDKLKKAVDEYYKCAFDPEIVNALKIVDQSDHAAKLVAKYAELGAEKKSLQEFQVQHLQMNLLYIAKKFSDCLGSLKLSKNLTLYIDGIDVRPNQIPYEDYLDCIRGLSDACWSLNTGLFTDVRDSRGHFRVVLLLRPDIFNSLNLQNSTNKIADNSVYLNWNTTYNNYKSSELYNMAKKLLSYKQKNDSVDIWEQYFRWELKSSNPHERKNDTAFMEFLKISLSRPRDIQRILSLLRELMISQSLEKKSEFSYDVFISDQFQNQYSEYFLGSLKDQLSFYYSEDDFKHFKKFFEFFTIPDFTYEEYLEVHKKYLDEYILNYADDFPKFADDPLNFLQLLYDSNVICAVKPNGFYSFSYREKSPTNISPEVPHGNGIKYCFHYGLYKKAKMGRY